MERYFFYLLYLLLGCSLCGCSRKQAPKQTQDPDTETTIPYADTIAAPVPPAPAKSRTARYLDSLGFVNIAEADSSIAIDLMYTRADNFTGTLLYEDLKEAYLHPDAMKSLKRAQRLLKEQYPGYSLIVYDADEDLTSKTDRQRNSYINFLPSLLVKWNVNDDFKVRGSFTQTLSRPKYSALVPSVNIKRSDNEITIGNPELKPTVSYNFDLSADYYFRSIGLISAGIFYKKIDDFIVDQVSTNYEYQGNTYTRFTQPKNAGNANLVGVELSYQRDFSFIAPALKCVGFYGTYTYTHSRVEDFNFEGRENEKDLSMPGSPEHTANASLYFEKGGLNLRLSYNFASDFIDEMGESTFYDRYYDKVNYMDVNASYTFGKKFKTTFYAEANNLLNQPLRYYQGTKDRTMQAEYYGVKVNAGVKINF